MTTPRTVRPKKLSKTSSADVSRRAGPRGVAPWPTWAPSDLRAAYDVIGDVPDTQWIERDSSDFVFPQPTLLPAHYLIGLSTQDHCRETLRKLATDLRMKPIWARLQKLESSVRAGKPATLLTHRPDERVGCSIARRCVAALGPTPRNTVLTRRRWAQHHAKVARTASRLRSLLADEELTHPVFRQLLTLFSEQALHIFADDLHFELGMHGFERRNPVKRSRHVETADRSNVDIDPQDARWKRDVHRLEGVLTKSIRRGAPKIPALLEELEKLAQSASRNPPFVGPGNARSRQVAALSNKLTFYFRRYFRAPLDEVVATIIDVLTDTGLTAAAVKVRRHRVSAFQKRMPR